MKFKYLLIVILLINLFIFKLSITENLDVIEKNISKTDNRRDPFVPISIPDIDTTVITKTQNEKNKEETNQTQGKEVKKVSKFQDITITGILWDNEKSLVIIKNNDKIFKEGDIINKEKNILIRKIEKDGFVLEIKEANKIETEKLFIKK